MTQVQIASPQQSLEPRVLLTREQNGTGRENVLDILLPGKPGAYNTHNATRSATVGPRSRSAPSGVPR